MAANHPIWPLENCAVRYATLSKAHVRLTWLGGGVLTVHIHAALYHHFVRHDGVLRAMVSDQKP